MRGYKYVMVIWVLLGSFSVQDLNAQGTTVKDVLDKATKFYLGQDRYRVDMRFTMYRGFDGKNVSETYEGTMERKGNFIKNSVLNTQIYQFKNSKVIVDDDSKTLTYAPVDPNALQKAPVDLGIFLEYYDKNQLVDRGREWVCEMVSDTKNFSQLPYGKVLLYIDKKNYNITRQELFFSNRIPFRSDDGADIEYDFGKLVIELKHTSDVDIEVVDVTNFIKTDDSDQMRLQDAYASYQLVMNTEENN